MTTRPSWRGSLCAPGVWKRGAYYGLPAGVIQAALNQGDHWMTGHVTTAVVVKTIVSPLVGFGVAYLAAVTTHHESNRLQPMPEDDSTTLPKRTHGLS